EAPIDVAELEAGEPEVEQATIDRPEAGLRGHGAELSEVRLLQDEAIAEALEPRPHSRDGRRVGIETEETAIRIGGLQDPLGVPTAADSRVDLKAAGHWREHRNDLLRQHRPVPVLHLSAI